MRRRILLSTSLIALAAVVLLGVPLALVGTALLHQRADMGLERRADAAAIRFVRAEANGLPLRGVDVRDLLPAGSALRVQAPGVDETIGTVPERGAVSEVSGDGGPVKVTIFAPGSARADDVGTLWFVVFVAGLAAVAAAAALALLQARRLAAPLEQLARRVERVGQPDYDGGPVAVHLPEIDQVQRALNEADHRISDLVVRERQFTANASHQMRSPLTALRMRLEELQALAETPDAIAEAEAAMTQVDRMVTTIEHLEVVARHRDDQPPPCDVGHLVVEHVAAGGWTAGYERGQRPLSIVSQTGLRAHVDPESVRQILDVLLDNALCHGEGSTTVMASNGDGWVRLAVTDDGAQPASDRARQLFIRGVGDGSGIGLAVARDLALRAGGDLRLDTTHPRTTFEALLPAVRPGA
ncbi:MAG: HAMP domain-containing sensor histidine kinase [Solirubrobacteraceae bacterium]|nr:HAMP domain-containing sensor histidine kinase [Solirubrobacteraceae bacterium]